MSSDAEPVLPRAVYLADLGHAPGAVACAALSAPTPFLYAEFPALDLPSEALRLVASGENFVFVVCSSVETAEAVHRELLASSASGICHYSPPEEAVEEMQGRLRRLGWPCIMTYCEQFLTQDGGR